MARRWVAWIALSTCVTLSACGATDAGSARIPALTTAIPTSAHQANQGEQMRPKQTPDAPQPTQASMPSKSLSQAEIEALVSSDLATRLKLPVAQIQIISTVARTWNDQGLGCARKGLYEPAPTPGYELTLTHNGQTFRYHTDLQGRFIRCLDASKPLGAIS